MQLKQLMADDDAVSPVIGVILMVAITVILAAVIATFVLGLGDSLSDSAPQASFSFDWDGSSGGTADLKITHSGGDSIQANNLYLRGDPGTGAATLGDTWGTYGSPSGATKVSAGNTATIGSNDDGVGSAGNVDVVWQTSEGENSATLSSWEGPDA